MKKLLSVIASAFVTASAAAVFSAAADYYEIERYEETVVCYKWDELNDYLAIEGKTVVLDPKKEDAYLVTENEDGSLTGKFLLFDPLTYSMTWDETKAVKNYLKTEYPEVRMHNPDYDRTNENFRMELYYFGFDAEMAVARDLKEEFGLMFSYMTGNDTYSITLCEGGCVKAPDGFEQLRELPFDELLKMGETEICALSPEISDLCKITKTALFTDRNTTRAHIALKDMTGMLNEETVGQYLPPTDEFSAMIGVPKKYILDVSKGNYSAASTNGKRFDNVNVIFDPDADEAYQPWYVQLLIDLKLAVCDDPNLYSYNFEQPGGGGSAFLLHGDVNGDYDVSIADAAALLQFLGNMDKYPLDIAALKRADCCDTGDGITTSDAIAIQKYTAGIITKLPYSTEKSPVNTDKTAGTATITVLDSETDELFDGEMTFDLLCAQKNMPEGAGGVTLVKGWNCAKVNPIVISDLDSDPKYSYFIQYSGRTVDGYTLELDWEKSQPQFDFADGKTQNIKLYVKKTYYPAS